jgi:DNA-binding LacI/PurR family transcriptional regulator
MATQYLINKGHTHIACIAGPLDKTPARLRLEGYRDAMARAGLTILTVTKLSATLNLAAVLKRCRCCWRWKHARRRYL